VAVKCDLCRDLDAGPACVRACPTEAIQRLRPGDELPDLRALHGRSRDAAVARAVVPRAAPAWPLVAGAVVLAAAIARWPMSRWTSGLSAGALVVLLLGYVAAKRWPARRRRVRMAPSPIVDRTRSRVRPHFVAHLVLGAIAAGVVASHGGARAPGNEAGALLVCFWATALAGAFAALAYAVIPRRLARLERRGVLPEDLPARARELEERAFGALSGRSDVVKALYARVLRPYARAPLGPLWLVARGATLKDEEARLRRRIDRALAGRASARLAGLDELVRLVVEQRALPAQRWLHASLRIGLPAHVVTAAVTMVLLAVHVVSVWRLR